YLQLARMDARVIAAFPTLRDVKELHARTLKPLMATDTGASAVLLESDRIAAEQAAARAGQGAAVPVPEVMKRLKAAATPPKERKAADKVYRFHPEEKGVMVRKKGGRVQFEFDGTTSAKTLRSALDQFLAERDKG
ncbi:MAG: chromosome partitioning protein ParB, partial [Pseudomonadota bacterium]|nr:chromosome partitioning protein ParB [Pseudomonadota bacterium]